MRIWLVSPLDPLPWEGYPLGRHGQLARELCARGHQLTWWAADFAHHRKARRPAPPSPPSPADPYQVRLLRVPAYVGNRSPARVWSHLWLGGRALAEMAGARGERRPELILCGVPPVEAPAAMAALARAWRVPLLLDIGDPWPDTFAPLLPPLARPLAPLLLAPHRALMRAALRRATAIIAVSQSYLDWALAPRASAPAGGAAVFWPVCARTPPALRARAPGRSGPFRSIFVGTFGLTYDLESVVEAAALLERRAPGRFAFDLVGAGPRWAEVSAAARRTPSVQLTGALGPPHLGERLRASHLGLCAYARGAPQTLTTKLFEYLGHGLPVLGTLRGEMQRFLEERGLGLTAVGAAAMAEAVERLAGAPELWQRLHQAAVRLSEEHDLEAETRRLADLVERLPSALR